MREVVDTEIGYIPKDWKIVSLTSLVKKFIDNRGKSVPTIEDDQGIHLIATNCIKEDNLFPVKEKIRFLNKFTYDNFFRDHPLSGDIIIVNKGTPGLVCMVPDPVDFCIAQDMVSMRVNEKVYNKYLFAYLRSRNFKYQVNAMNVGTTIPHLKKTNFKELYIPLPSKFEEQKDIGDFYYLLSEKIHLLRQQNMTLEALAQLLFKRWFVDFEFPDKDGKPYKSNGGKMVKSELGEIPEGWEVLSLTQIANYLNGLACQKFPVLNENEKLPVLKIKELGNGISDNTDWANSKVDEKYIVNSGDIVFSWSGTLMLKVWDGNTCVLNQHLFKVTSDNYPNWLIYHWTNIHLAKFIAIAKSKATTMGHIKRNHLDEALCIVPTDEELRLATKLFKPILDNHINNSKEIQTLTELRDTLLPKLMSGAVRVKNDKYE